MSVRTFMTLVSASTLSACAGPLQLSFLEPQGPTAALQRTHFFEVLALLAIFVALPIFLQIPWLAWHYRYGAENSAYTPKWRASKPCEILSWTGPIVIVALLGVLVWRSALALDPYRPLPSAQAPLRVQVIGYDWKWLFIYPEQGVASIGVLPLPTGRPIEFELTSATVMQSLLIPALGSQIYAMGGMVTKLHLQADREGSFLGENTMYSGDGFHQQHFIAVGMTPRAFHAWVERAQTGGMPLDDATLGLVAKRTTLKELQAALQPHADIDGGIDFKNADPGVFMSVVHKTMNGRKPDTSRR